MQDSNNSNISQPVEWYYNFITREIVWSDGLFNLMKRDITEGPILLSAPNPYLKDEQRVLLVEWVRQCVHDLSVCTGSIKGLDGDGNNLFLKIHMKPVVSSSNQVEAIEGTIQSLPESDFTVSELPGNSSWYLHLINSLDEVVFSLDDRGNGLFVNTAWERLSGYTMPDFILIPFIHFVDEEFREQVGSLINQLSTCSSDPVVAEIKIKTKEAESIWVEFHARCTPEASAIGQITGTLINIHVKKEAERTLQHQQIAISNAVEGIAVLDAEGKYVYLNKAHVELFGFSSEKALLGKSWKILYDADEQQRIANEFMPVMQEKGLVRFEAHGIRYDGKSLTQEICLTSLPEGGLICVTHDITERREQEAKAEELAMVANLSNLGVALVDRNGMVKWINLAMQDRLGQSLKAATGRPIISMLGNLAGDRDALMKLEMAISNFEACRVEYSRTSAQGDTSWFMADLVPDKNDSSRSSTFILVENDITEQKLAASETRLALERERELNSMKTQFIQMASHEFRTPMASIQTSIDVLKHYARKNLHEDAEFKTVIDRHHERMLIEIQRMTAILSDVLLTGKLDSGNMNFKPLYTNPVELIKGIWDEEKLSYIGRNIRISVNGEPYSDQFDRNLMGHLFKNLISNAFKYGRNGEVPEVTLQFSDREFVLIVSDKGIGVPEAEIKNLFQSFFRASNTDNIPGTGLGLPLVKKIAEMHDGWVEVHSKPGIGSTFAVHFPKLRTPQNQVE
jgi:PAS domain S-box-containing protein